MRAEFEPKKMELTKQGAIMRKDDPRYIEATIKHSPSLKDPLETRIIDVIKNEALVTPWAKDAFKKLKEKIVSNWKDAYSHLDSPKYVHDATQEATAEASDIINATIISGEDNLNKLKKNSPVMIVSNHLATYKLVPIMPEELREIGVKNPLLDVYYPYIAFFAPFYPIAKILGNNIYEAAVEAPGKLGEIFRATGSLDVPPASIYKDRVNMLTESTKGLFERQPNAALVIFPEGGATGKRNGKGIYDLEKFHTGAFVIAAKLNVPILPVTQDFNPNGGFELGVLESFVPEKNKSKGYYENIAESTRGKMQEWLNQRKRVVQMI